MWGALRSSSRETGSAAVLRQLVGRRCEGCGCNPTLLYRFPLLQYEVVLAAGSYFTHLVPFCSLRGLLSLRRPERGASAVPPGLYPNLLQMLSI